MVSTADPPWYHITKQSNFYLFCSDMSLVILKEVAKQNSDKINHKSWLIFSIYLFLPATLDPEAEK
jgi:hypothetical protein